MGEPARGPGCLLQQLPCVESAAKPYPVSEPLGRDLAGLSSHRCRASCVGDTPGEVWNEK